jgi:hypothetical protein
LRHSEASLESGDVDGIDVVEAETQWNDKQKRRSDFGDFFYCQLMIERNVNFQVGKVVETSEFSKI